MITRGSDYYKKAKAKSDRRYRTGTILGLTGIVAFFLTIWIVGSYFEARAYERVTGERVTTAEAMFLSLRVTGQPKSD